MVKCQSTGQCTELCRLGAKCVECEIPRRCVLCKNAHHRARGKCHISLADPVGGLRGLQPRLNFQKKIVVIRVAVVIDLSAWPL